MSYITAPFTSYEPDKHDHQDGKATETLREIRVVVINSTGMGMPNMLKYFCLGS